jgi:uracil-DNA glycosylase
MHRPSLRLIPSLERSECFFTNAYVGLKEGEQPTGRFPGANDARFRRWCQAFLVEQIEVMKPRVVATLGIDAARFAATLDGDLSDWDARLPMPGPRRLRLSGHETNVVALAHPSGYHASLVKRRFDGETGLAAEAALLRAVAS